MAERAGSTGNPNAEWLLLVGIACLPLMKPPINYPLVLPDLVFALLFSLVAAQVVVRRWRPRWRREYMILPLYVAALAPSLLVTSDLGQSLFKLTATAYLAGLALLTALLLDSEAKLRRAATVWLIATASLSILAVASVAAFAISPANPLYAYAQFHFGTLPPGDYPRLSLTFLNANMACNYLTVSIGLLFAAVDRGWIGDRVFWPLLALTVVAAMTTISPGLGGVALALGCGFYLTRQAGATALLWLGLIIAAAFLAALSVTPIAHSTAPFAVRLPGTELFLYPSARFLIWSAAAEQFLRQPLIGHGIGIDPVDVRYADPSGNLQRQTDAHNLFLSLAGQAGLVGLAGLTLLVVYVVRLTCRSNNGMPLLLGLTFLNAFLYQGIGGSFEDTRHLWVLLGLLIAAARISFTHAGGNNRISDAPSPC